MAAFLYDIAYTVPVSLASVMLFYLYQNHRDAVGLFPLLILTAAFSVFFALLRRIKTRGKIAAGGVLLALFAGLFLALEPGLRETIVREHVWILGVAVICLLSFLFETISQRVPILRLLPILSGLVYFALCLIRNITPGKVVALSVYFYMLFALLEQIQKRWKKEGDTEVRRHLALLLPYLLLAFLVLSLLRMPDKIYDWSFVKKTVEKVKSRYEVMMSYFETEDHDDRVANVGFSDDAKILGRLGRGNYEVLRVSTDLPKDCGVYLAGESFDRFDGRIWEKTDDSAMNYEMLDILETTAAILAQDESHLPDYLKRGRIDVECIGTRTDRVFLPLKAFPTISGEHPALLGGDLVLNEKKQANYRVDFFRINTDHEGLKRILTARGPVSEANFESAKSMLSRKDAQKYSMEDLEAYHERIRKIYCEEPGLSDEMRAFLQEKLEGADNDYEKLLRIEEIFKDVTYTRTPGELPKDVNSAATFLDHFLFRSKTGYCTHYATAFVLMARSQGIPARYLQGYCFNSLSGSFPVSSSKAHAWAQAYIEGFGWVDLDATPSRRANIGWQIEKDGTAYPEEEPEEAPEPEEGALEKANAKTVRKLLFPIVYAAGFALLFLLLDLLIRRIRYQKADEEGKVRILWGKNMRILKRMGCRPEYAETLSEFRTRAGQRIPKECLSFIGVYETLLYADAKMTSDDVELFLTGNRRLREERFRSKKQALLKKLKIFKNTDFRR